MTPTLRLVSWAAICAAGLFAAAPFAAAQDLHPSRRSSPMGMARATLADDGTYVSVVYSRPYERGRDNVFGSEESGALVPYGKRWRTGANEATEITLTGDVTVGGEPLVAGTYSLTSVPGPESWTLHFNSVLGLNGTARRNPESGRFEQVDLDPSDVLVVRAPVTTLAEKVEQFTIAFEPAGGGADMCLSWITTEVCVPIRVVEWSLSGDRRAAPSAPGRAHSGWSCANDLEVQCSNGSCDAASGDGFTPMSVHVDAAGAMSVCAYSGCWEGTGNALQSGRFLVLVGAGLDFSTSADPPTSEDIVVVIDRTDGVGTLKAGAFAQPLLCAHPENPS